MFGNTGKQLKVVGKEALSIFKSLRDDIRQEIDIQKKLKNYRKELLGKDTASKAPSTHAHEDPKA